MILFVLPFPLELPSRRGRPANRKPYLFHMVDALNTVNAEEMDLGTAACAIINSFSQAVIVQEVDTKPVVRPKTVKVSTPQDTADQVVLEQDFLNEMRQFMQQQQRNEKI